MIKTFDYEKLPIVEVVNEILYDSAKRGASDIHFDPEEEDMIVIADAIKAAVIDKDEAKAKELVKSITDKYPLYA